MNLPIVLSNCCGDCFVQSKIPMLLYPNGCQDQMLSKRPHTDNTSKSDLFYDCQNGESRRSLNRRHVASSSHLHFESCRSYLKAATSFMSIEQQHSIKRASSELILKQCKTLLENYSLNIPTGWAASSALTVDDLELLHRIVGANERYDYLSEENIQLLANIIESASIRSSPQPREEDAGQAAGTGKHGKDEEADTTFCAIEEIFRKRSETKRDISDDIVVETTNLLTEKSLDKPLLDCTDETEQFLLEDFYDYPVDFDPGEMIERVSFESVDLQLEYSFSQLDYSEAIISKTYTKNTENPITSGLTAGEGAQLDKETELFFDPELSRSEKRERGPFRKVTYEWYAFNQEVKKVIHYSQMKSTLAAISVEYDIKCLTYEELQNTDGFYKHNSKREGFEVSPLDLELIRNRPEELLNILKLSDISYLHKKVMADIDERFTKLNDKLRRIREIKSTVPAQSKNLPKPKPRRTFCNRRVSPKTTSAYCGRKDQKLGDEFHEVISLSSVDSTKSSYFTVRDSASPYKYKESKQKPFLSNQNRFGKLLKS